MTVTTQYSVSVLEGNALVVHSLFFFYLWRVPRPRLPRTKRSGFLFCASSQIMSFGLPFLIHASHSIWHSKTQHPTKWASRSWSKFTEFFFHSHAVHGNAIFKCKVHIDVATGFIPIVLSHMRFACHLPLVLSVVIKMMMSVTTSHF